LRGNWVPPLPRTSTFRSGPRCLFVCRSPRALEPLASSSLELFASFRVLNDPQPASYPSNNLATTREQEAPSLGLLPHRDINQRRPPTTPGSPDPGSSSVRDVSRVLDGFLRHQPCGLVSSRCHVQGLPFRGLSLAAEPYRVSPADSCPRVIEERPPAV